MDSSSFWNPGKDPDMYRKLLFCLLPLALFIAACGSEDKQILEPDLVVCLERERECRKCKVFLFGSLHMEDIKRVVFKRRSKGRVGGKSSGNKKKTTIHHSLTRSESCPV